ncbi:LysM peptidoglycan-binding domain-containing protein [Pediococcus acidilactici]|uniref:aggregation-promoting factor n=1 Tax=Pediococcus acidilactici TaxID=1254 RepID=UPI0022E91D21|nr:LysM peptidoglycan-binding domain-containing protein [Pediococcus acidilactici]
MSIKSKISKMSIALLSGAAIGAAMITTSGSASADEIYTVKSGDTLSEISYSFGLNGDYNTIAKANNIADVNVIYVGQKLKITNDGDIKQATNKDVQQLPEVKQNTNVAGSSQAQTTQTQAQTQTSQASVQKAAPVRQASTTNNNSSYSSNATGNEAAAKAWIVARESGGSYTARNGQYIGKYQLSSSYLNGDYSAANQERVADNYVKSRYGSWSAAKNAWVSQGWY